MQITLVHSLCVWLDWCANGMRLVDEERNCVIKFVYFHFEKSDSTIFDVHITFFAKVSCTYYAYCTFYSCGVYMLLFMLTILCVTLKRLLTGLITSDNNIIVLKTLIRLSAAAHACCRLWRPSPGKLTVTTDCAGRGHLCGRSDARCGRHMREWCTVWEASRGNDVRCGRLDVWVMPGVWGITKEWCTVRARHHSREWCTVRARHHEGDMLSAGEASRGGDAVMIVLASERARG